jgi:hypothetical protein
MAALITAAADSKAGSDPADVRLFNAIDTALRPSGMLMDLSHIIAEFARTVRWVAGQHIVVSPDGCTATVVRTGPPAPMWVVSDMPIGRFPSPAGTPSLRAWTIRIDASPNLLFPGVRLPKRSPASGQTHAHAPLAVAAAEAEAEADAPCIAVCTWDSYSYRRIDTPDINLNIPHSSLLEETAGSLYHFTADLSTGTLRVRPELSGDQNVRMSPIEEWTTAEGVRDLAECSAAVALHAGNGFTTAFTLLCG